MTEIALIGDKSTVLLAKSAGMETVGVTPGDDTKGLLSRLVKQGIKVIFITQDVYAMFEADIKKYESQAYPIIVPIPGRGKSDSSSLDSIKKNMERAIGVIPDLEEE